MAEQEGDEQRFAPANSDLGARESFVCSGEQQQQWRGAQGVGFLYPEKEHWVVRWNRPAHSGDEHHAEPMQMEGVRRGEGRRSIFPRAVQEKRMRGRSAVQQSKRREAKGPTC